MKRLLDIIISLTALLILSPILMIVIIAMKLESRGPAFYVSKRVGQNYKIFDLYKFRTMFVNADQKLDSLKHLNQYADEANEDLESCSECTIDKPCSSLLFYDGETICENLLRRRKLKTQKRPLLRLLTTHELRR